MPPRAHTENEAGHRADVIDTGGTLHSTRAKPQACNNRPGQDRKVTACLVARQPGSLRVTVARDHRSQARPPDTLRMTALRARRAALRNCDFDR